MKLFADFSLVVPGKPYVILLSPFWGKLPEDPEDPNTGRFDRYVDTGRHLFELTSLDQADLAVFPSEWTAGGANELARQVAAGARQAGKRTAIFFNSDSEEEIDVEGVVIFRTSFQRSRRQSNEFALPAWSEDFIERYLGGQVPVRGKKEKPVVGFCGHASSSRALRSEPVAKLLRKGSTLARMLARFDLGTRGYRGPHLRAQAIGILARSPLLETNFVLRTAFWNGAMHQNRSSMQTVQQARRDFVENMVGSDYILCVRGGGNFSYRLYETLSCGRIPVFIDTDCVLPYEQWIDWRKYCVWVPEADLPQIAERIAEFHKALSPAEFCELQRQCRALWEEWLSPVGFFSNFYRHFEQGSAEDQSG